MSWQTSKIENGRSPVYTPSCWRLERVRTYLLRIALVSLKPCSTHRPFTYFQGCEEHSFHWGHSRHGNLKWLAHTVEQNYQSPKHLMASDSFSVHGSLTSTFFLFSSTCIEHLSLCINVNWLSLDINIFPLTKAPSVLSSYLYVDVYMKSFFAATMCSYDHKKFIFLLK